MSAKNAENTGENRNFLANQNDVEPAQSEAAAVTAAVSCAVTVAHQAAPERTSDTSASAATPGGAIARSSSSGGGGPSEKRRSDGAKRKTRRGKAKRGKRSSSSRPYSKSQWKFHVRTGGAAASKRRADSVSDHPPLVPYNTNRFLMEDHMPHVLTPSEDEEEFLTKEFSSVYEDARSERLEGLSKTQLIQEYLQLEANFEQVTRRFAAKATGGAATREENESAVSASPATAIEGGGGGGGGRRLEDRIRELTAENLELRRQLEHASRIGMVLSAKSSPRPLAANSSAVERMDSSSGSSSADSESDSSSSSSSSSGGSSSSSMSDDDDDLDGANREGEDRQLLVPMIDEGEQGEPNGYHQLNGVLEEDEVPLQNGNGGDFNGAVSPLSAHSINSPPPPLVMN